MPERVTIRSSVRSSLYSQLSASRGSSRRRRRCRTRAARRRDRVRSGGWRRRVAVPEIEVDVGRLGVLAPAQDQRPVAGNFRNLLRGSRAGSDEGNGGEQCPGLDDIAPRELAASSSVTGAPPSSLRRGGWDGRARSVWPPLADCRIKVPTKDCGGDHSALPRSVNDVVWIRWQQEPAAESGWFQAHSAFDEMPIVPYRLRTQRRRG